MASNGTLTNRQRKAIAALMSSRNVAAAAQAAGVGLRTLHRWLDDPAFVAELQAAERQAIDGAIRQLADLSGLAVDTLRSAMNDAGAAHAVKIRAADIALARLIPLKELADLEQRIAALEAKGQAK
jgi:phage terminase small subunit